MTEERLREIVREEILAARLAEEDHEHPELQHDHYGLAPLGHDHDIDLTHDHYGEYADVHHSHYEPQWG